jgi:hypothetical protein
MLVEKDQSLPRRMCRRSSKSCTCHASPENSEIKLYTVTEDSFIKSDKKLYNFYVFVQVLRENGGKNCKKPFLQTGAEKFFK